MKMKMNNKILSVLLAVCFLMSVTVAAVGAARYTPDPNLGNLGNHTPIITPQPPVPQHPAPVFKGKWVPGHYDKKLVGKWVPGHYDKKLVNKMVKSHGHLVVVKNWKHGHLVVVKVWKNVWVPGQWVKVWKNVWVPGQWVNVPHHR
jgi:hypothetical protein